LAPVAEAVVAQADLAVGGRVSCSPTFSSYWQPRPPQIPSSHLYWLKQEAQFVVSWVPCRQWLRFEPLIFVERSEMSISGLKREVRFKLRIF